MKVDNERIIKLIEGAGGKINSKTLLKGETPLDIATKKNIPLITSIKNFINSENKRIEIVD